MMLEQKIEDLKRSLLTVAIGVKQKDLVNKMVEKVNLGACKSFRSWFFSWLMSICS